MMRTINITPPIPTTRLITSVSSLRSVVERIVGTRVGGPLGEAVGLLEVFKELSDFVVVLVDPRRVAGIVVLVADVVVVLPLDVTVEVGLDSSATSFEMYHKRTLIS